MRLRALLLLLCLVGAASADDRPRLKLERLWQDLEFDKPTHATSARDGTGRIFVCEQRGRVQVVSKEGKCSVFLDITDRVRMEHNEEGLLSIAFHPKFKENGFVFVCYSHGKRYYRSDFKGERKDPVCSRVSRFKVKDGKADPDSEKVVIEWGKPWGNHNGGQIDFGHDGFLYAGPGDGGAGGDPEGNGQRLDRLLGKMLRIDVDKGDPYSIPADNPWKDVAGAKPEVFAYGLRNPWRFSFDRKTGALWVGDVGQDKWEAVKKVEKGTNHGWNIMEGSHPYAPRGGKPRDPIVKPVYDYGREDGLSITGGFVYRGKAIKELEGIYVFGDYGSGHVFGLKERKDEKPDVWRLIDHSGKAISSFGEDEDGEILLVHHAPENGQIFKLVLAK
ncbi:MAG TPA: PQQ-dependent sugar dehydrogenase [Planctomycetota bacterium]|nr:PQQ-dependent sugar dehydrogenase [Planctomycetota bacterium]